MPAKRTMNDARRILTGQTDGCWFLPPGVGGVDKTNGYAYLTVSGVSWLAHRLSYTLHVGPILDGLTIDHQCHNRDRDCVDGLKVCIHRPCFNPAHLEAVTIKVNNLRGGSPTARNARKVRCSKGHPLPPPTEGKKRGWCPECRKAYRQERGEVSVRGRKVDRTHCPQGHEYTPANTYRYKRGNSTMRHCRQCGLDRATARRLARIGKAS
jgi:hypothetical protein